MLITLIERCVRETAAERGAVVPSDFNHDTPLFGREGIFDSMGLVTMVVEVEEAIADEFGVEIALADHRAMSEEKSPYTNISALAAFAQRLIDEAQ